MKRVIVLLTMLLVGAGLFAQDAKTGKDTTGVMLKYRRSSLYSVIIEHPTFPYAASIDSAFFAMPIPDKFNDHNIQPRVIISNAAKMKKGGKNKEAGNMADIDEFIATNKIPRDMIAKWFDRNPETGAFDMNLVQDRGFYDASAADISAAEASTRNFAILGDAGEELIGKTFMIVNDITFVDKGEQSAKAAGAFHALGSIFGSDALKDVGTLVNEIDGFTVNITTYLYRLVWNDEVMGTFYKMYWISDGYLDDAKKAAFENSDVFSLDYIGATTTSGSITTSKSFSKLTKDQQMLKAVTRAVDKAIVELQRAYDEFKVNVPIGAISADGKTVEVPIGLKEGVNEKSRYDVLMPSKDPDTGKVKYKKVAELKPVKGKIWDNRFGALEEAEMRAAAKAAGQEIKAEEGEDGEGNVFLTSTTFDIVIGANAIVPGCVVKESTIKTQKKK
ncbi:MAG: hypothetical protein IKP46_06285 [Bacteroidales bacterium]|nr:hypothetical protein [Bacteroidales bacterium]